MKKFLSLFYCLLILFAFSVKAQHQAKRFPIKSGHIEMTVEGSEKGSRSIWFDNYGLLYYEEYRVHSKIKVFGVTTEKDVHEVKLMNGSNFYSIDLKEKKGTKYSHGVSQAMYSSYTKMSEEEKEKFANQILEQMGGKKVGKEMILGRECEKINMMGVDQWVYKGIELKISSNMMGVNILQTAHLFEENISIPSSRFEVPEGIEIRDLNASFDSYSEF